VNLHGLASGIQAVNPSILATFRTANGYTTGADGTTTPIYTTATGPVQVQALTGKDLQHLNNLNIQGVSRKGYCYGNVNGVVRASSKGGDTITLADGTLWKVATVFESWPDWSAVGLALQVVGQ